GGGDSNISGPGRGSDGRILISSQSQNATGCPLANGRRPETSSGRGREVAPPEHARAHTVEHPGEVPIMAAPLEMTPESAAPEAILDGVSGKAIAGPPPGRCPRMSGNRGQ